jgi:hypothetical protein
MQKEKGGLMNKGNLGDRIQVVVKHRLSLSSDLVPFPWLYLHMLSTAYVRIL